MVVSAGMYGVTLFVNSYLQNALGFSSLPTSAAFLLAAAILTTGVGAAVALLRRMPTSAH